MCFYKIFKITRDWFLDRLYTDRIRNISKSIGLHSVLKLINDFGENMIFRFMAMMPDTKRCVQINNVEATYLVTSGRERSFIPHFATESGEKLIISTLISDIRPDDVFWDIGANIGQYTCLVGQKISSGEIVAFEPHPHNAERLRENMELNKVVGSVEDYVLSSSNGEISFDLSRDEPGGMGKVSNKKTSTVITVPAMKPDELVRDGKIPQPSVIKIDIAGEEWNLMKSMSDILSDEECRLVTIEIHEKGIAERGGSVSDIRDMMDSYGFTTSKRINVQESSQVYHILFRKNEDQN